MLLADEIKKIVKGDVSDAQEKLKACSTDASIFEVQPELIVAPCSGDDIKALVRFVTEKKTEYPHLSLTARAAGTDMSGGPLTESIVVDFLKYFQEIKSVDIGASEATVLPGTYYRDFEKATLSKGLLLPCYTASKDLNTVGGMVANNSAGEKTLTFGATREYVKELKVVLSDGEEYVLRPLNRTELIEKESQQNFEGHLYREFHKLLEENKQVIREAQPKVHKNSAGYDLWDVWDGETFDMTKVIVGSQGTLGLVTEIKFGLIRPKIHSSLLVIFLDDLGPLAEVIKIVLKHKPESFESFDDQSMKLAVRFMPDMFKQMGAKNLISLGLQFWPEIKMILLSGVPKLILIAEFTGDSEEEIHKKALDAENDLLVHELQTHISKRKAHIAKDDREENKYWTIRHESFSLLRKHIHGKHTAPFIDDIVVNPEYLPKFLPELNQITKSYDLTYTIAGHIGDGNFHIIPLMDFGRPDFVKTIKELEQKVFDLVAKYHGSIAGEHNDGLVRTPYLNKMYRPEVLELFAQTKKIFDPLNIFNPGKKTEGDLGYALSHIRHW
ncbi:MAG TPA: FAD-binding oxidoreductase [Candidatus Paceibacterota bacterium]